MSLELRRYDGDAVQRDETLRDRVAEVYAEVFAEPPYAEPPERGRDWAHGPLVRHAMLPAFELVCAEREGVLLGFAYGVLGSEDSWFAGYIRDHAPREVSDRWLGGHGELAELAVRPQARGLGFGGALHDAVAVHLTEAGADRAILVTQIAAAPARALYAGRGWHDLAELAPGSMLMGRSL
ncbi:GNAT family N-acetyltransferase [Pseudactinotalea sp.]|uniref:GNAT family N-acetyltransferase n=1 Tax=Pseudactinotalea sp. TaxID=1926260 RepID=UPI003B3A25BE